MVNSAHKKLNKVLSIKNFFPNHGHRKKLRGWVAGGKGRTVGQGRESVQCSAVTELEGKSTELEDVSGSRRKKVKAGKSVELRRGERKSTQETEGRQVSITPSRSV
jgi:hypothetical protein